MKTYIELKRNIYFKELNKQAKTRFISSICEEIGADRKYVIKLLNGSIKRGNGKKGRTKKYTEAAEKLFIDLWKRINYKCPEYIHSDIDNILKDLSEVRHIEPEEYELVRSMSVSTMNRILRKYGFKSPRRRNKRSGYNNIFKEVPCKNAEFELPSVLGEVQIDTVQLCGDTSTGSCWWIHNAVERLTQWDVCMPVWNRSGYNTKEAISKTVNQMPFKVCEIHSDSGNEFMNHYVFDFMKEHGILFTRSRIANKNDNARVEQKNSSLVRCFFGYKRLDQEELEDLLWKYCYMISLYNNLFCPCKRLISREPKDELRKTKKKYDTPKTPLERVKETGGGFPQRIKHYETLKSKLNRFQLLEQIKLLKKRIYKEQERIRKSKIISQENPKKLKTNARFGVFYI